MARRKTIGDNPLDAIEATSQRPAVPVSPTESRRPAREALAAVELETGIATSLHAGRTQALVLQAPDQLDLLGRIKSLEEQNVLMRWLVYGAIGLALLLW